MILEVDLALGVAVGWKCHKEFIINSCRRLTT